MTTHHVDHQRVNANGLAFHVALAGPPDGPLLVLLHGFPEFWYGWRHQIGPLVEAGWRVAAPDQRGYGASSKPAGVADYRVELLARDVVAIAEALGHSTFGLIGHDWGGMVAWEVAARHTPSVTRLAILNAPRIATVGAFALRHPMHLYKSSYVAFFQVPALPELVLRSGHHGALVRALTADSRKGAFTDEDLACYRDAWEVSGAITGMLNWYRALSYAGPDRATRIDAPTMILWGDRDTALEAGLAEAAFGLCEEGEIIHLKAASHWLHHDEPRRVSQELVRFFSS